MLSWSIVLQLVVVAVVVVEVVVAVVVVAVVAPVLLRCGTTSTSKYTSKY